MSRVRRRSRTVLALAAALGLARLAGGALGPRYGGDLTVAALNVPADLDPAAPRGAGESLVALLVHERLLRLDADGQPQPGLVRDWLPGASGREWLLRLSPDARFHDGQPVGTEDGARAVRRFLRSPSPAAERLAATLDGGAAFRARQTEELPGVAGSASEIVLRFGETTVAPLAPLASPGAAVVSAGGVGAGPFVPTAALPGKRLALTASGTHVRGRPLLDRVVVVAMPQAEDLELEIQTRRAGLVVGAGAWGAPAATLLFVMDATRPAFAQMAARAAVAEALARSDLAGRVLPGAARPAGLLPPRLWPSAAGAADEVVRPSTRAATAVTLAVSAEVPPLVSQRLVAHLDELGLRATVAPVAPNRVLEAAADARLLLWAPEVPEPELALRELAALAPLPRGATEGLAVAARETDPARRRALLHEVEKALRATAALVPLAVVPPAAHARPNLHGVTTDRAGRLVLEDAWLEP